MDDQNIRDFGSRGHKLDQSRGKILNPDGSDWNPEPDTESTEPESGAGCFGIRERRCEVSIEVYTNGRALTVCREVAQTWYSVLNEIVAAYSSDDLTDRGRLLLAVNPAYVAIDSAFDDMRTVFGGGELYFFGNKGGLK